MKKRLIVWALLVLLQLAVLLLPVCAQSTEANTLPLAEWQGLLDAIPQEVADLLPDGFFSQDMTEVGESVAKAGTLSAVLRVIGHLTGAKIGETLALLARLCGIVLVSCAVRAFAGEKKSGTGAAFSLLTVAVILLMLLANGGGALATLENYFGVLRGVCVAMLPLMGALYAMGGNIGAAVANHGMMSAFLALLEALLSTAVLPVAGALTVFAVLDALSDKLSMRSLANLIKRSFTLGLSFLMMLLSFVLGLQTTLAKGTDTLALRTVRFAAGSFLPVVGGSISEALRTVSGSVTYLRGAVGVGGILVVLFVFLPPFLSVLLTRLAFLLSGAVAGMLSCTREERFLSELASIYGYFLAVIACLFITVVFSLTLMAHCAAAV